MFNKIKKQHWAVRKGNGFTYDWKTGDYSSWRQNSGRPKYAVFQDGQLMAFNIARKSKNFWYDQTGQHVNIPLKKRNFISWNGVREWTPEEKANLFISQNGLKLNEKTGRYDADGDVLVTDKDIRNGGHLPVKLGDIKGDFNYNFALKIKNKLYN